MGSVFSSSKVTEDGKKSQSPSKSVNSLKAKGPKLYAELVTDLPSDIPPLKVFIHDQLAISALGSLKSSEEAAQQISKSLILDLLNDRQNYKRLGVLLRHIFQFEYILEPTRNLLYWSLDSKPVTLSTSIVTKALVKDYLSERGTRIQLESAVIQYIQHRSTVDLQLVPMVKLFLVDHATTIKLVAQLSANALPGAKDTTKDAIKSALVKYMQSKEAKDLAKSGLVSYLRHMNNNASVNCTNTSSNNSTVSGLQVSSNSDADSGPISMNYPLFIFYRFLR